MPNPPDAHERIRTNLLRIQERIANAAARSGRAPDAVRMVAVTKSVGLAEVQILHQLGLTHFGESRVDAAKSKILAAPPGLLWHMIGTIQRRKVPDVVDAFPYVDAVDRLELAQALQRHAAAAGKRLEVLVEVNVSGEQAKHGFAPAALPAALETIAALDALHVRGLMTMAPFDAPENMLHSVFATLRELARAHQLPELSMGMSDDFEIAVEEGATEVRMGRGLFL
jgi:pyridoxal phosphate enzyme (YggS family)